MSQRIHTPIVNVVELVDMSVTGIAHFNDNDEGNREAEEHMFACAKENGYVGDAKDVDEFCDEEGDTWQAGTYTVLITHS